MNTLLGWTLICLGGGIIGLSARNWAELIGAVIGVGLILIGHTLA